MPISVETKDREKPLLLIVGSANPFINKLISEFKSNFKIAKISKDKKTDSEIYNIDPKNAGLVKNLEEKIEYAIIFLEEDGIRKYVEPLFEKLVLDGAKTILITDVRRLDQQYDIILAAKKFSNFNFVFNGDIYSEKANEIEQTDASEFIESVIEKKSAIISPSNPKSLFAIYIKDAILAINQILLGPVKKNKFYYLFYGSPLTYLSAVHIIERVEPDLQVSYQEDKKNDNIKSVDEIENEIQGKLVVTPAHLDKYFEGFEKSLGHYYHKGFTSLENSSVEQEDAKPQKPKKQKASFGKVIFTAILLFIVTNLLFGVMSILLFKNAVSAFQDGNYSVARNDIKNAKTFFDLFDPTARISTKVAAMFGFNTFEKNYDVLTQAVTLADIAGSGLEEIGSIGNGISKNVLDQKISDAFFLYFEGQEINSQAKNKAVSEVLSGDLPNVLPVSEVASQILGYAGEKKYLLLFQNNGELRPTGGFIGSVGELDIKNGKIEQLKLQDVYAYDGQLKAHVEPYYIVRRYLQPHLYLRDSNFDPDFQNSASTAALLYNLETNKKVDGVIAINFEAVRQIIGAVGPIKLASYNKTLDANNTFDFLENTIDNNFFPGSTQKKDVLQALFNQIVLKLQDKNNALKVASVIPKLAKEKNILFAFNELSVQSIFSSLNLGGQLSDLRTNADDTISDFLAVNEANIGVNKANINVSRNLNYTASFVGNKISSNLYYQLTNTSSKDYKVYLRFFTPLGSKLNSISIDNQNKRIVPAVTDFSIYEKKTFRPPDGFEVDQSAEDGKQEFGFITTVGANNKQTILLNYDNGQVIPSDSVINYSLLVVKQPGISSLPLTLNLNYGDTFSPKEIKNANVNNGQATITRDIKWDQQISAQLIKQ